MRLGTRQLAVGTTSWVETAGSPFPVGWEQSDAVAACEHREWQTVHLLPVPNGPVPIDSHAVRCANCWAPRCGHSTDQDPCMLVRHHGGARRRHLPHSKAIALPDLRDPRAVKEWLDL